MKMAELDEEIDNTLPRPVGGGLQKARQIDDKAKFYPGRMPKAEALPGFTSQYIGDAG